MTDSPTDDAEATESRSHSSETAADVGLHLKTGSRLHFGLLDTVAPFGGVGVMIDSPATEIRVERHAKFYCDGSRVEAIAKRVAQAANLGELPACRVTVTSRPPAHSGLGSGTQLAMATAEALCRFVGHRIEPIELARQIAARGERSAVGIHGYFHGGLIFESADQPTGVNPVRERIELSADWCVALFRPQQPLTLVSGDVEREQFAKLAGNQSHSRRELQQIVREILSSAKQADFDSFVSAVGRYNHQSGLLFESVQGGAYNGEAVSNLIGTLIDRGARGVGQSSWGPSVFAWFESQTSANEFVSHLPADFAQWSISKPRNQGRTLTNSPEGQPN